MAFGRVVALPAGKIVALNQLFCFGAVLLSPDFIFHIEVLAVLVASLTVICRSFAAHAAIFLVSLGASFPST